MTTKPERKAYLPPRWFVRTAWVIHRALYKATGGRFGLRQPQGKKYGMLRLTTVGRHTGKERNVILGYQEDGPNLAVLAMNGWAVPDPAWWLNLQAHPNSVVTLSGGERRAVTARLATDDERSRLWDEMQKWRIDDYAWRRTRGTPMVILEPRSAAA
jgi:deazaflavin-dependent oxidoreductase (nitroreductase family)